MSDLPLEKSDDPRNDDEIAASLALTQGGPLRVIGERACQTEIAKVRSLLSDPLAAYK